MTVEHRIHGHADEGFGPLADAFAANFAERGETGAACVVYHQGRKVVDLWGGVADARTGTPWEAGTAAPVFSVTKSLVAIGAYMLVERGALDLDAPIAAYRPEFAQEGKADITVRQALSHRAGLLALDEDLTPADVAAWDPVIRAIERQKPLWEPGSAYGYHALTYGWLIGEVIHRITGMRPGRFLKEAVTDPLRAGARLGLPEARMPRVAHIAPPVLSAAAEDARALRPKEMVRAITLGRVFPNGLMAESGGVNDPVVQAMEIPGGGAVATADGLARIHAALVGSVDGVRLIGDRQVHDALVARSEGLDWFGNAWARFGIGFQVNGDGVQGRRLLSDASFGHDGAGGQLAFADADAGLSFGYVNGGMLDADTRAIELVLALRVSSFLR